MTWHRSISRALAVVIFLCGSVAAAVEIGDVLIVDLYVNHERMGDSFVLTDTSGNFYVDERTLRYWEIRRPWPAPRQFAAENYYSLAELPGTSAELDSQAMELRVDIPAELMPTRRVNMQAEGLEPEIEGLGAFLDYDLNWLNQGSSGNTSTYGLFRPVVFGPFGNVNTTLIYRNQSSGIGSAGLSVLEMTYTRDNPDTMRSLRIGDVVTAPGENGRAIRLGGIQLATNFATRPTLITYPLPDFYGQTAVPSAIDIYVNGRLSRQQQVQPGSFVLEDVPVINGAGQMQVVATDALGRQQMFTEDFYLSTDMLAQGLSDYSLTIGALREDYGQEDFRYGDAAASATWRHGLRDDLTIEGHGEFSEDVSMIGGALRHAMRWGATVSGGLAISTSKADTGVRWQAGFHRQSAMTNLNLGASGSTQSFAVVGNLYSTPKVGLLASVGRNLYSAGTIRASGVHQELYDLPRRTIWSVDYATVFRNGLSMSTYVSYLDSSEDDISAGVRFFFNFGEHHSVSGTVSSDRFGKGATATVQRNMPMYSGYGYHLTASRTDLSFLDAGAIAQNDFGAYYVNVRHEESAGTTWQAGARGSVAVMDGMARFARQLDEAFAVVNVGNIEGVRVYSENVEVGRTNSKGQILVPRLRPYLKNQLSIELEDLPLNARIGDTQIDTAPFSRSGVIINFDVRVTTNLLLRAVTPDGQPVPEGAIASVFHTGDRYPVGRDGKLYLQGIDRSSQIEIRWSNVICELEVPYPASTAVIAKVGDIECTPVASN
jgi:outer membrane usher protein